MKPTPSEQAEVAHAVRTHVLEPAALGKSSTSGERRLAFDVATIGMGILGIDGRWLSTNTTLTELVGRPREEMLALSLSDLTHPDDLGVDRHGLKRLVRGEIDALQHEKRLLHRSGTPIWVLQQVTVSRDSAGRPTHFIWQGRDLTEDRRMRAARSQAEERLRVVVEHAPILLWSVDTMGMFTLAEGRGLAARGAFAARMAPGLSAFEAYRGVRMIEADGRSCTGECLLRRALGGESCSGLAEIGEARHDTKMVPLRGPGGEVVGVIGVATDVTERTEMQAHILQTDRLVALGTLAAGVAHEINNPLTYVMGNLELVSRQLRARAEESRRGKVVDGEAMARDLEELSAALSVARDGSERVRRIVRDLTMFARSEGEQRTLLDVRAVLGPVLNLVANEIRQRARLVQDLRDVPLIEANEARFGQVLMNLLINAAQAIPEGDAEAHEIGVATYTDERGRAVCEVRDSGSGIPEEVLARIFEPFFTTKPVGLGTGLGLSICHGTITALGGEITVRSTPNAGSVFRVAVPAVELGRRPVAAGPASVPAPRRLRARILVIDDEPLITHALQGALAHHEVEVATRAQEALERLLGGARFDVILCDLLMPGMTGMELGETLAEALPEQAARVVYMTGGAFTARAREFLERVPNARLSKPLELDEIEALIHAMVEGRQGRASPQ